MRRALLAKGPDSSSLGEVHKNSCPDEVHMEEEEAQVKVQVEKRRDRRNTEGNKVENK